MNVQYVIDNIFRRDPKMKANLCYSQNGEDLILNRFLENKEKGFFIDVGAHHPIRFSNTYFFYKKGWSGINIDAMPGSMTMGWVSGGGTNSFSQEGMTQKRLPN